MIRQTRTAAAIAVIAITASHGALPPAAALQQVDELVESLVERQIERAVEDALGDALERDVESRVSEAIEAGLAAARTAVPEIVPAAPERFEAELDPAGRAAERGTWVVLVTPTELERVQARGFAIRERRPLDGLGRILLRIEAPGDRAPADAALELAVEAPSVRVDRNHLYRPGAGSPRAARPRARGRAADVPTTDRPTIAIVDSRIDAAHEAFDGVSIVQRDFVGFDLERPAEHGTAVASLLVGRARGVAPAATLLAASVLFDDGAGGSTATTAGIVRALDWAVAGGASVVNMSLTGPPNRVLESALEASVERGAVVVAAVGNAGPAAPALYPAAYPTVVGVTAVDERDRVYRYANRGPHVTFAAPGVEVEVAAAGGGYRTRTGTSMAAPHVAGRIALALAQRAPEADTSAVLAALRAAAVDLGPAGFDEIYGHGRIGETR